MTALINRLLVPRTVLLAALTLFWANFFLTWRWALIPGSIHGPREPWYLAALGAATIAAFWPAKPAAPGTLGRLPSLLALIGFTWLCVCFLIWFPPQTWHQIPLLDNWPARFQSTMDALDLLKRGALTGWQWDFLGGYHSSSDVTVTLAAVAGPWIALFGPALGFHVAHMVLFLAIPALVYVDVRLTGRKDIAALAAAIACLTTANLSYFLLRSGDTNSLAALAAAGLTLTASHACALGYRRASLLLVGGLGLVTYCHAGFFVYTAALLIVEAACYRDAARLRRAIVAIAAAMVMGLPLTWESWVYPDFFRFNNVLYEWDVTWPWFEILRKIYYNVELLWLPNRWFNDFSGLTNIALPIVAFMAWRAEGRARFHAWGLLTVIALMRFNIPQAGYAFQRPIYLLPWFLPTVLAAFILSWSGTRWRAVTLLATVALYLQVLLQPVPHISNVRDVAGALVDSIAASDGAMVLVENHYHRDMIVDPAETSPPTPFPGNFEALLPGATGKRLYAGVWDGWQWSPYRGQLLANGAWDGRALERVPHDEFISELERWGVRHLFVWTEQSARYLDADPRFVEQDHVETWRHFTFAAGNPGDVMTPHGTGTFLSRDPLGARIRLDDVTRGDLVIVRTNYHPAWSASANGTAVPLRDHLGQLTFDAPADGEVILELVYPRRRWLLALAGLSLVAATWLTVRMTPGRGRRR